MTAEPGLPIGAVLGDGRWRVVEILRGGPDRGQLRAVGESVGLVTIAPPLQGDRALLVASLAWTSPRLAPILWAGPIVGEGVSYDVLVEAEPDGVPLDTWRGGADARRRVALELAETVRDAHDRGLVLGGLRPDLVYATPDALAGVAPRAERFFARATERSYGVPPCFDDIYLAPEQLRLRPPGPPADVFSLGATLARLFTGRAPFAGATVLERMGAALAARHGALDEAGPLAAILAAAMSAEPSDRPAIEDVCRALQPVQ